MKHVILPPDASTLMWSTRAIGYTTPAAVADLIDNSISAGATNISIQFISGENSYISILDNGNGMSREDLCMAMKYGSGSPWYDRSPSDLGRFGLGLKTASLSQCRRLTVVSKKENSISAFCWDLDHVISARNWELIEFDNNEILSLPQVDKLCVLNGGTVVIWENLDKIFAGDEDKEKGLLLRIKEVEEHLALTFHRFLQGEPGTKKVTITSNGISIKPADPFFISKSDEMPSEKITVHYKNPYGNECSDSVIVTPYILPFSDSLTQEELTALGGKEGLIKNQGFYVYRNKRLIVAADWFRIARKTDLTKLCRVKVDMPSSLDEIWTIDVKKSMAFPPETVLRNLRRIITPIIKAGKRKYKFRATKETSTESIPLWVAKETRNGMLYEVNPNYPILKELLADYPDKKKLLIFLRLLEQNIPVNAIHTDFYDDKKFAFEDVDVSYQNVISNLRDLLTEIAPDQRKAEFDELMQMLPFSEYEIRFEDLGEFENG